MDSQKNLSHSSLICSAAPPRRSRWRPGISRFFCLGRRASSLDEVNAARGGLDGGDGRPEVGTSGIPLRPCASKSVRGTKGANECPLRPGLLHTCNPGSAVVHTLEVGGRVDDIAGGKDIDPGENVLAISTTVIALIHHGRHNCYCSTVAS